MEDPLLYRVQVGVFRNKENADRLNYELLDKGYPSYILQQDGYYKVQVGAWECCFDGTKASKGWVSDSDHNPLEDRMKKGADPWEYKRKTENMNVF